MGGESCDFVHRQICLVEGHARNSAQPDFKLLVSGAPGKCVAFLVAAKLAPFGEDMDPGFRSEF